MKEVKKEVKIICPNCGQERMVLLTEEECESWKRYLHGEGMIQNMLPDVPHADRELLRGGMCGECWKEMFGNPPWEEADEEETD